MNTSSFLLLFFALLLAACSGAKSSPESHSKQMETTDTELQDFELVDDRTEQEKALDALNEIQKSGGGSLFSTFANIKHSECKGPIETYEISSEELETALLEMLDEFYDHLPVTQRKHLAATAAKAQTVYQLTTCGAIGSLVDETSTSQPQRKGTWILYAILDQRDVVIVW